MPKGKFLGKRKFVEASDAVQVGGKWKTARQLMSEQQLNAKVALAMRRRFGTPELKYFYTLGSGIVLNNTVGRADTLVAIAQGNDEINRIGDRIRVKKVEVVAIINSTNAVDYGTMTLFIDKQANGTSAQLCTDFSSTTATPLFASSGSAPFAGVTLKNPNWDKRFKVLQHLQWSGTQQVATAQWCPNQVSYRLSKTFSTPLDVEYSNTTGVAGSIATNNIYFGFSGEQGANTTIAYYALVHYYDM